MDLSRVRSKFSKVIDFFISNITTPLKIQMSYSLQQDSLNSRDLRLLVTCKQNPKLLGKYIIIENQYYIVHNQLNEPFSLNQYVYYLLPCNGFVEIRYIHAAKNAIVSTLELATDGNKAIIDGNVKSFFSNIYPAYIDSFMRVSSYGTEIQPNATFDVNIFLPTDISFDQKSNFVLYYQDNKYKLTAILKVLGAYKLSVIKDV